MLLTLKLSPESSGALTPMSPSKGEELAGREVARMCCNEVEKLGFDLRVTEGFEGFEMRRCDVHSQRIPNLKGGNLRRETEGKPYSAISVRLTPVRGHT